MATTGLGGALAGLALGGGNAWGQVGNNTLPTGGQVVAGQATINQQGQNTLNINQTTDRAAINWSSFDVGKDATVNFYQPNSGSWTVNRVTAGMSPSQILGSVNANGNIIVINPNGVIFGQGSRIDVNGIIATTSNISNQNFMAGNMKFDQAGNPNAMVVNQGDITVRDAGLVAFVAPGVSNSGTITANLGRVSLASGNKFTVDLYGDKLVSIAVDGGTTAAPVDANGNPVGALVSNSGSIFADGGRVQMTAQQASAIVDNAINMSGVVRAQSAYVARNGDIVLDAGPNGNVVVTGTLDVSGQQAGTTGGSVTVTGKNDVTIAGTARIDASGKAGGGTVKIGGDYQGRGTTPTAKRTLVATGAQIDASAVDNGNGGTVIVWADDQAVFGGAIAARGGANGGNGGFIETSGKNVLTIAGTASVDASAANGTAGSWLLDPRNITVANGGGAAVADVNDFTDTAGVDVTIDASTIETVLNAGTSVTLQANNDIIVDEAITATAMTADLTMQAGRSILVNANITVLGNFTATANDSTAIGANRDPNTAGNFVMAAGTEIDTSGANGNIIITVGSTDNATFTPGSVTLQTLSAGTGDVTVNANNPSTQINVNNTITANDVTLTGRRIDLTGDIVYTGGLSNAAGVPVVVNVLANTADLDDSVDLVTAGGSTITVAAGNYARTSTWNIDVDDVIVRGAQSGVSANTGGRTFGGAAESTLDYTGTAVTGVRITGDNVTFDGFSMRMDVTSLDAIHIDDNAAAIGGPSILNNWISAPTTFAQSGITNNGANGLTGTTSIVGNRIENYGGTTGRGVSLVLPNDVLIGDLHLDGAANATAGVDLATANNVTIVNMTVAGIGTDGVSIAQAASVVISGVEIEAGAALANEGIDIAGVTGTVEISNVQFGSVVGGDGIVVSNSGNTTISSTFVQATDTGIRLLDLYGAVNVVSGVTITGGITGIAMGNSPASNMAVTISGTSISGFSDVGIFVVDNNGDTFTNNLTLGAGNSIDHAGNTGIRISGVEAGLADNSLNNTVFISDGIGNAASKYVELANGAEIGSVINGLNASYDGTIGSAVADATTAGQIEAKFVDDETLAALGNIVGAAFTTVASGAGLDGVQAALDAYDAINLPGTVVLLAGDFTATDGTVNQLTFNEDGVLLRVDTGAVVNLEFDAGAAVGAAIVINAADVQIDGGAGTLNILANANYTHVIHVTNAVTAGGNLVLNDFNIGNFVTNFTGHGIFVESPGVDGDRSITLVNITGAGNAGMGIFIDPTAGDTTISGGNISGMAVGIAVDDHTGSLVIVNNTINDIAGHAITINNVQDGTGLGFGAGNVQVSNNVIADTASIQGIGIAITTVVGNVIVQNNDIGSGATLDGGGILIVNVTGAASGVTVSGGTVANYGFNIAGSDGVQIETVLGATSQVVVDSIVIDGNSHLNASDGLSLVDVRSANVTNATIMNSEYGIFVLDNTGPAVNTNTTLTGISIINVSLDGIEISDSTVGGTTTVFFGAGNVIDGTGAHGIQFLGSETRVGNASTTGFNDLVLTNITGDFLNLFNAAVFAPGNPTVVRAQNVHFDLDNDGIIDAGERGSDYVVPTTQAELDAIFAGYGAVEDRITHNLDDATLGLIQILPNAFVLTNTAGGLLAIQTATNALGSIGTGQTGAVFVGAGTWGAPEPTTGTGNALTITNAGTGTVLLYGTQAFTPVPASARLPGNANETILDFTDVNFTVPLTGGIDIRRTNTSVSGFSMQFDSNQLFGVRVTNTTATAFTGINVNNNFLIGNFAGGGNLGGVAVEVNPLGVGQVRNITVTGNSIANVDGTGIYVEMNQVGAGAQRTAVLSNNIMDSIGQAGAEGITLIAGSPSVQATVSNNTITNSGAGGLSLTDVTNYTVNSNVIDFAQGAGIAVVGGGSGFTSVAFNRIGTAVGSTIAGNGIDAQASAGALNINNNTIGNAAGTQIGGDGISVLNSASTVLRDNTILGVSGDGVQVEWGQAGAANVTIAGLSIDDVGENGIYILENGTGSITTTFLAGVAMTDTNISGVNNVGFAGLVFDGNGTRVGGNILQNLNFLGAFPGDFITLQNDALFNPNNPTQILASSVGFDFDASGTIDVGERGQDYSTNGVTNYLTQADRVFWGNAESRITHYIDDQTLGFIRMLDTAIVVADPAAGLSSIQRAINLSAPTVINSVLTTHTVYVNPGSYGDPSTAQGGLDVLTIPYSLNFLGWNDGTNAISGGRTAGGATESILNFAGATVPTRGLLIQGSGVLVDGMDFAFDSNQTFGIRIDDSSVARSNITIVNNFVRGTVTNLAGDAIGNVGTLGVTGVTITGNNIDSIGTANTHDAVDLQTITGLILQNNLVGTAAGAGTTILGHGFVVDNSTYATSLSGNTIFDTGLNGIALDNAGLAAGGATNFVSIVNNTLGNIGESGITANRFRTIALVNNTVGSAAFGVGDSGIVVSNTNERVTITGNSIYNIGNDGATDAAGIAVTITAGAGLAATADAVSIANNTIVDNNATNTGLGIFVGGTANGSVQVIGNSISGIDENHGIFVLGTSVGNVIGTNNTINTTGDVGFWVDDTGGSVTLTNNTANNTGEDGLLITDTTGGVRVVGNFVGNTGSIGTDSAIADAVQILNTGGNVTVDNNTIASGADVDRDGVRIVNTTGNVSVFDNSIGVGAGVLATGDGVHINDTDGAVSVVENSINDAGDDGIAIVNVGLNVEVISNVVTTVGGSSVRGDGILVTNTGTVGANGNLNGTVRVLGNNVSFVNGNGAADSDDGLSSGDGIRVSRVDGNVVVGNDGNTVANVGDDGIEINGVVGSVSSWNNTISNTSTVTTTGDGIVITNIGNAYFGGGVPNAVVSVTNNTITDVNGDGTLDALTDGLSGGDGIRISDVDGGIIVTLNQISSIGNDGIQGYNINQTSLIDQNRIDSVSDASDTGDGIVIENTGTFAASPTNAAGGSVVITRNSITNVFGAAVLDTDAISPGGQSLSSGDGIRAGAIDGEVLIGGTSTTGNSIQNASGDGIQVYYVTGQDGVNNAGVTVGYNFVLTVGQGSGGDLDGDGIQISKTGRYGGSSANFTGDVNVFNNVVNEVDADFTVDRDDGFTSGDGVRIVQADGNVTVSANQIGAGASVGYIDNDGIQIHTVTRAVTVAGNTVGSAGGTIGTGGGAAHGDGIVVENTGSLSGAAHAVAGEGDVLIVSNNVSNVIGDGTDDTDVAVVPITGLDSSLTSGDGIRVGYADGQVVIGGTSATRNTVSNVGDDGIQVYAVSGVTGDDVVSNAVSVTDNLVTLTGALGAFGDGIVVSYTGSYVTDAGGTVASSGQGGVLVARNTVNDVTGNGADDDDDRSAGDGIRVRSADGHVLIDSNLIANLAGGDIDNDGIQVWDVTRSVSVNANTIGTAATIGTGASGDGDGIVIENTGKYSTRTVVDLAGNVDVTNNFVSNVVNAANIDADGGTLNPPAISALNDPNQFLSAGDGIRVAFVSGTAQIDNNDVINVAGDGIQAYFVQGSGVGVYAVEITRNAVTSVGNGAGGDGDGIQVSFTGAYGDTNATPQIEFGDVLVQNNDVEGVIGNGADRDDARSAGDGIRVRSAAGNVLIDQNDVGENSTIDNDGIQVWDASHEVTVSRNTIGAAGAGTIGTGASGDGDGIVVENTGTFTTGGTSYTSVGAGAVLVISNRVTNVIGDGTDDADGVTFPIGGGAQNNPDELLTAGDGIRVGFVDGDVTVGGTSTTGNTISNVGDDGIQVYAVTGAGGAVGGPAVLITDNRVSLTSAVGTAGDGIVVSYTGLFVTDAGGTSGGANGLVRIHDNTVDNVGGNGADDDDDRSAGDGIRVRSADTGVDIDGNNIATQAGGTIANDGIQVWDVKGSATVNANTIGTAATIGTGASGDGDGIAVENIGGPFSTRVDGSEGSAYVTANTVRNVGGLANADADGSVSDFGGLFPETNPVQFLSSGDGVRVGFVATQVSVVGNIADNVTNDGIQVYAIRGADGSSTTAASVVNNTITNVGNGAVGGQMDGDGISVAYTGNHFITGTTRGGSVFIDLNRVDDVAAATQFDRDDDRTAGDGIRVRTADGSVTISNNRVATNASSIANDGVQVWDVVNNVLVRGNTIGGVGSSIGATTVDGDGIVVENTGTIGTAGTSLAAAGDGGVTVIDNTISNVFGGTVDDRDGVVAATGATETNASAGDGIRVAFADGDVLIHNNDILRTGDDGIQVLSVTGNGPNGGTTTLAGVTITNNIVTSVGNGTNQGDGIVVSYTGTADLGSDPMTGGVLVQGNVVNNVLGNGPDDDDGLSAGDGVRLYQIDGDVTVRNNTIAAAADTAAAGQIDNDGIQISSVGKTVLVLANVLGGVGGTMGTGASGDGDGVVVENTGTFAGAYGVNGGGATTIQGNTIVNVAGGAAGADADGGYTTGDGIRATSIDGPLLVLTNTVTNVGDDGIQADNIAGSVTVTNNLLNSIGNVGPQDGDGIVISDVGLMFVGSGPAGVTVIVDNNSITNVAGDGLADPDDVQHSNGDGIRIVRVDGSVQANANSIERTADDGIYIGAIKASVNVRNNWLNSLGNNSATGDGIVVAVTGSLVGGTAGAGDVTILNNTVSNVNASSPASPDFDNPFNIFGAVNLGFSAGDGIRAENIDGDLVIGDSSTTGNSILNVDDDGIQVDTVRGSVTVLHNRIATVGIDGNRGDGIAIADVGNMFAGLGGPAGVSVIVDNNTITSVNGNGLADPDDAQHSNGDGIRVVRVDGSVQTNTNTINSVDDDGIYIGAVKSTVNVRNNRLTDMGLDSATGDGIVVAVTGSLVGGAAGAGDVTILNNTVTNVNANAPASPDFDNPFNIFGGTNAGFSAGDGIRAENIDGDLVVGDSSTTGNSILNVDDDGIQVDTVRGSVTVLHNRIATVGVDGNRGDGITVADVGNAYAGLGGPSGVSVLVNNNTITGVNGDGTVADPDDAQHGTGDGIRIVRVDGSVQTNTNTINSADDDGIYVGVVRGTVNVLNNRLNSIGLDSDTGDGIVVSVTGEYAGGTADGGDVTINGNSIANVDAGTPGAPDFDDPAGQFGGLNSGLTAGDGIRAELIDGDVVIGLGAGTGNSIQVVDDDGIQVFSVTGGTTIGFNSIANVSNDGASSTSADGIQVNLTGQYASLGFGVIGAGDVVVINNDITNVQNLQVPALNDPEDLQTAGDGIRLHDISGDVSVNNNFIDPIADDGIQIGNVDFSVQANSNTILDTGFTSATGDGILVFNTGIVGLNDGNGSVTVNNNTITNVGIGSAGVGAADPDDGGYGSNDGVRIVTVDGAVSVSGNRVTNTRDDGIQIFDIQRSVSVTNNVIATVGAGSSEGDGIVVSSTGTVTDVLAPAGGGDVTISGNSITNVTGNGAADNDDALTAGDGVRVSNIDGQVVIASNVIQTVGNDGVQAISVVNGVSVTGNHISVAGAGSLTGDGVSVEEVGSGGLDEVVVAQNTIVNVAGDGAANVDAGGPTTENDGIRVYNVTVAGVFVEANVVTDVGDDGVEVHSVLGTGNVNASNNTLNSIGTGTAGLGDGIIVTTINGGATAIGNTIANVLSANGGNADNVDGFTAGDGIRISNVPLNVVVGSNTVTNAADDGVQAKFIAGTLNVSSNRIDSVSNVSNTGDGIDVNQITGDISILSNVISRVFGNGTFDPDGSGLSSGDGVRVELSTGALSINGNSIDNVGDDGIQVDTHPNNVTANNNRINDFGNLTAGAGDGIVIADTTGNVLANGNSISNGNGSAGDLDDMTIAGDAIRIIRTSGSVDASNNNIANIGDNGIEISSTGGTAMASNNALTGVANVAISVVTTTGAVTTSNNTLTNNGTGEVGDIGILLTDFASAVVVGNTIVNVAPGSLNIGIDIGNVVAPLALITMTGNSISDANTGLFIRENVMGTVTGNTFTNNVVWGVQIDNTVSGNGIGQGLPGDVVPTIDIWFRDNFLNGNGAPNPGDGVTRGGINNLNPGPLPGGFIFDARMNNFNGQTPFTTGTHFESPSTGGAGDAVSDWVRIDIVPILNPVIPYYDFGSLLDNFGRGGDAETPGDVLAIGPTFDRNGNLFDAFFVDTFGTAFGLSGDPTVQGAIGTGAGTDYAMCYLANMWKVSSCRKAPPPNN